MKYHKNIEIFRVLQYLDMITKIKKNIKFDLNKTVVLFGSYDMEYEIWPNNQMSQPHVHK